MKDKLFGMLGLARKAGRVVLGNEMCMLSLKERTAKVLILATDASERTKEEFIYKCKSSGTPYLECGRKDEIGLAVGKSPKAVVSVTDQGFADAIMKLNGGGENVNTKSQNT